MLSTLSNNWSRLCVYASVKLESSRLTVSRIQDGVLQSQPLPPTAHWHDLIPRRESESPVPSQPALPDCSPVSPIQGDTSTQKGLPIQIRANYLPLSPT